MSRYDLEAMKHTKYDAEPGRPIVAAPHGWLSDNEIDQRGHPAVEKSFSNVSFDRQDKGLKY